MSMLSISWRPPCGDGSPSDTSDDAFRFLFFLLFRNVGISLQGEDASVETTPVATDVTISKDTSLVAAKHRHSNMDTWIFFLYFLVTKSGQTSDTCDAEWNYQIIVSVKNNSEKCI